ncbi:von Willebrand factor A [Halosimplex carlsbadense 2-9-1]|uniref:von Willebrand factor A n=1 Tax=Halosimplex carlsbadense 2-9-1 TaxID=797114 RepID=M0D7S6_9EURY|nr:VWA domain-containing protein [Halosimplex carlsbadense]ELZ30209.1 von Willebrand factor A [Halosimplex carlsbadense 2-9-1]
MRQALLAVAVVALVVLAGCGSASNSSGGPVGGGDGASGAVAGDGGSGGSNSIGVSAGGAADANAFRSNVEEGYVPQPTDLTYEGLFHDYYFDTGQSRPCEALFCPSYSTAVTRDPLANDTERFVTVGLNSGVSTADFERKPLNLVVVVDTSGSMSDRFSEYYDDGGEERRVEENQPKIDAAGDAVVSMLGRLNASDRVGVVAYDNTARTVQGLQRVGETDRGDLRSEMRSLRADGGTNLDAGMSRAEEMLSAHAGNSERETRVVYVTDAMPNLGETDGGALESRMRSYANRGIHTTFVGVGVDFNSRLTETVSTVRGANYYTVDSPAQFDERMDEGFAYMVTPLVYNLSLEVAGDGYRIENVYGSPQADAASAELMEVTTLFPSRREGNKTEGGVVLLEVAKTGSDPTLDLVASYEDPGGGARTVTRNVSFESRAAPSYGSTGVRKAVALAEYGNLVRNWMAHERAGGDAGADSAKAAIEYREHDGQWEQSSVDLAVSAPYDRRFDRFVDHFRAEKAALGADRMERDLAILERLAAADGGAESGADDGSPAPADRGTRSPIPSFTEPPADDSDPTAALADEGGDSESASNAGFLGRLGSDLPLLGAINLLVTLAVAAYGVSQKRQSRATASERME